MTSRVILAALALSATTALAQQSTTPDTSRAATMPRSMAADTSQRVLTRTTTPPANDALGLDAEIRVAMMDLLSDRVVPALARLQRLAASPVALNGMASAPALRNRQDLMFLLAESEYRFGMDSAFRATAEPLLGSNPSARYASLLGAQLVLAAYRSGDYARAAQLAASDANGTTRPLTSLVGGLAAYQMRNYPQAHQAFGVTAAGTGPLAQYAKYMDILTGVRADTGQVGNALTQLDALASSASGEFADQVRATAAQLAYQSGNYSRAASLAGAVSPNGGYGSQALLTQAWALYKGGQVAQAQAAFAQFADRYPNLPERDESRLMAAQSLLQLGRTDEAGRVFQTVADSATAEAQVMDTKARAAMTDAAQALVKARAAGLLFVRDPSLGKTVALGSSAGAEREALVAALADSGTMAAGAPSPAELVTLKDLSTRLAAADTLTPNVPQRVYYMPASATSGNYSNRAQALFAADLSVGAARFALEQQLAAYRMRLAMFEALQQQLAGRRDSIAAVAARLTDTQQRLAALAAQLDAAAARIRAMMLRSVDATMEAANENTRMMDSLRANLGGALQPEHQGLLAMDAQTIASWRNVAQIVSSRIDEAIRHHPVLALRDSLRSRSTQIGILLAATQRQLNTTSGLVDAQLAQLRSSEPPELVRQRGVVASAEAQRNAAEAQLVAAVDQELRARATEMVATLRRDGEAAAFGSASSSFFRAIDATQNTTNTGAAGTASTTGSSAAQTTALVGTPSPSSKQ